MSLATTVERHLLKRIKSVDLTLRSGHVRRVTSTAIQADGPGLPIGSLCSIPTSANDTMLAQVVAVDQSAVTLVPLSGNFLPTPGARVTCVSVGDRVAVGDAFLGRAVDALGLPLDGFEAIAASDFQSISGLPVGVLDRMSPKSPLRTGVRAVDALLTLGRGQRVGIFAASGVGKTTLLTQLATSIEADRCVICLVGERGREAESLWSQGLSSDARRRSTMIVATADEPAAKRVRAAHYALALAEFQRDQGHHVLLMLDSVTRLAMAMRDVGLAANEPPTVRAYTPSVFAQLPRLVERCGAVKSGGAITALMTVLTEADEAEDPLAELMKSLLDGHIILSRELAEQGHFPAINVPRSVSRMAREVCTTRHLHHARQAVAELALYEASRVLIDSGMYVSGANAALDSAIQRRPRMLTFLQQSVDQIVPFDDSAVSLGNIFPEIVT